MLVYSVHNASLRVSGVHCVEVEVDVHVRLKLDTHACMQII